MKDGVFSKECFLLLFGSIVTQIWWYGMHILKRCALVLLGHLSQKENRELVVVVWGGWSLWGSLTLRNAQCQSFEFSFLLHGNLLPAFLTLLKFFCYEGFWLTEEAVILGLLASSRLLIPPTGSDLSFPSSTLSPTPWRHWVVLKLLSFIYPTLSSPHGWTVRLVAIVTGETALWE